MAATLHTHELVKELKASGFTDAQAEAVTHAVTRVGHFSDPERPGFHVSNVSGGGQAQAGSRLIKWAIGIGIAWVLVVGGMIWAATQVLLRALPHL